MRSISELAGTELLWEQPARTKRDFELHAGEELLAVLRFQRGSLADAAVADCRWTFKREGFGHPRVTVRMPGADTDLAVFRASWTGGGTLEFAAGNVARLSVANVWHSQWLWHGKDEAPLVRFKARQGFMTTSALVDISAGAGKSEDLPLLVVLGWYLILLYSEDSAAASTAAVVTTMG